MFIGLH
jgi:hypothetical protein